MTFESKLDKMCAFCSWLHGESLYGERRNVRPPTLDTYGLPGVAAVVKTVAEDDDDFVDSMHPDNAELICKHERE